MNNKQKLNLFKYCQFLQSALYEDDTEMIEEYQRWIYNEGRST
jgi:hypothetical protein